MIKKACYLFFYKIYSFFKELDDLGVAVGLLEWRTVLIIQTLEIFSMFIVLRKISRLNHSNIFLKSNPLRWAIPIVVLMILINYYGFLYRNRWREFEHEFKSYSQRSNYILNFIVLLICIGIPTLLICTFY